MNTQTVTIEISGEPEGKGRARSRLVQPRFGKQFITNYTPEKTRKYEAYLKLAAQEAMEGREIFDGALECCVYSYHSIPASWSERKKKLAREGHLRPTKKPDWDNLAKVCDALNKVVWTDDSQVVDGFVRKMFSDTPGLVITVRYAPPVAVLSQPTLFAGEAA